MSTLRRDLDDWGQREPVWSVFVLLMVGLLFTFAAVHALRANWDRAIDDLAIGGGWLLLVFAKLEASRAWRVVGRLAAGQAVKMTYVDPETGTTTVYDLSQGTAGDPR